MVSLLLYPAPVVQRIERAFPKRQIRVRFTVGARISFSCLMYCRFASIFIKSAKFCKSLIIDQIFSKILTNSFPFLPPLVFKRETLPAFWKNIYLFAYFPLFAGVELQPDYSEILHVAQHFTKGPVEIHIC